MLCTVDNVILIYYRQKYAQHKDHRPKGFKMIQWCAVFLPIFTLNILRPSNKTYKYIKVMRHEQKNKTMTHPSLIY